MKDDALHTSGETVSLKNISLKYLDYSDDIQCEETEDNVYICTEGTITEENYIIDEWNYNNLYTVEGYTYLETDKDVMNFAEYINDFWEDNRVFTVSSQQTFTMPSHNVLFSDNINHLTPICKDCLDDGFAHVIV